ncbi:DUF4328 domain-containing protein [Streptomyces sp. NPDC008313]|uniref:DUF4328 domain-containing protein n=1 Tax=Streptomyces sp. NPDC008313 TaxID=3364826 RepID=UPI0036EDE9D8
MLTATTSQGLCDACAAAQEPGAPEAAAPGATGATAPPAAGGLPVAPPLRTTADTGGAPVPLHLDGHRLVSPVPLGRAAAVLLGVTIAVDLFSLWVGTRMYSLMSAIVDRDFAGFSDEEADNVDRLYRLSGFLQIGALVATAVVFIVWFRRVRINAEVFSPGRHSKTRGWAVWGWFVPVANLWYPRRIALDTWDASGPDAFRDAERIGGPRPSRAVVNAWWTLWIVSVLFGRYASSSYDAAERAEDIKEAVGQLMLSDCLDIAAAVLAILFVLRLTRMQHEKGLRGPAAL